MKKVTRSNTLARRLPLTRDRILNTALDLADKSGLESVSMRQVALGLGVEAMSLYKYVSNKDDLLDGLVELVVVQISVPSLDIGWKQALKERALSERKVLNLHPWAVTLFESTTGTGVTRLRHQNHMTGILRRAGFSIELALNTLIALTGYVYGFVILEQAWSFHPKAQPKVVKNPASVISETEHPYIFELVKFAIAKKSEMAANGTSTSSGPFVDFEFGLNLILDGLERTL
ncbi:MAG: TetR/AcrR family transcriptional regulator [Pseudobdellovibrio sp.]